MRDEIDTVEICFNSFVQLFSCVTAASNALFQCLIVQQMLLSGKLTVKGGQSDFGA